MQHLLNIFCQAVMKKTFSALLLMLIMGCTKDPKEWITGTVMVTGFTCEANAMQVFVDKADPDIHPFLCHDSPGVTSPCRTTIYIKHMPPSLATPGTRIKFSIWEDFSVGCSSSSFSPHYLEVKDLSKL
jgi:hypothetical protein